MRFARSRNTCRADRESLISLDGQKKVNFGYSSLIVRRMLGRRSPATSAKVFLKVDEQVSHELYHYAAGSEGKRRNGKCQNALPDLQFRRAK